MRRVAAAFLILLATSTPSLATPPEEVQAVASDGLAVLHLGEEASVRLAFATLQLTDDQAHNYGAPNPYNEGVFTYDRHQTNPPAARSLRVDIVPREGGAKLVVLSGNITAASPNWTLAGHDDSVLEASHLFRPEDQHPFYYEYRAHHDLNASLDGRWRLDGELQIYVWNAELTVHGPGGTNVYRTGQWTEGETGIDRLHHYAFALLAGRGAFEVVASGNVYADALDVDVSPALLAGIQTPAVPASAGLYRVQLQEGRIAWTAAGEAGSSSWWPAGAGLVGLAGLLVITFRARGFGTPDTWTRRALRSWDARHPRRALLLAHLALLLDRRAGEARLIVAEAHAAAGRDHRAGPGYLVAFRALRGQDRAVAAFGAARVAARAMDPAAAGFWLRTAADLMPDVLRDAAHEPDFRHVAHADAFRRQVGISSTEPVSA